MPSSTALSPRFGSLTAAYARVGIRAAERYHSLETEARMRTMIEAAVAEMVAQLGRDGIVANFEPQEKLLRLEGKSLTVTIGAARCLCEGGAGNHWRIENRPKRYHCSNSDCPNEPRPTPAWRTTTCCRRRNRPRPEFGIRMTTAMFANSRLEAPDQVVKALEAIQSRQEL